MLREVDIMERLKGHPNVVALICYHNGAEDFIVVMSKAVGGDGACAAVAVAPALLAAACAQPPPSASLASAQGCLSFTCVFLSPVAYLPPVFGTLLPVLQ